MRKAPRKEQGQVNLGPYNTVAVTCTGPTEYLNTMLVRSWVGTFPLREQVHWGHIGGHHGRSAGNRWEGKARG